jgi:hypothetical protein
MSSLMVPCFPDSPTWGRAQSTPKFRDDGGGVIVNLETGQRLVWDPYKRTWTSQSKRSPIETKPPVVLLPLSGAQENAT